MLDVQLMLIFVMFTIRFVDAFRYDLAIFLFQLQIFAAWYDIGEVDDSDEVFCSPHDPGDDPGGRIEISSQASSGVTEQLICGGESSRQ